MAAAANDPGAASGVLAPPSCGVPSGTPRRSSLRSPLSLPASFASLTMGYPDRLLAELQRREREQRTHHRDDPEADDDLRLGPAEELEVVMDGRHAEDALAAELEGDHLPDHRERLDDGHPAHQAEHP